MKYLNAQDIEQATKSIEGSAARLASKLRRAEPMSKLTKRQKALEGKVDALKLHAVDDAIKAVRDLASAKFDETLEIAMNLGVDPRHADQMVRGDRKSTRLNSSH